ncbi:MAG: O-antigen ligase family protein [Phycisphaeraceae bacterium]|nr:O-antigen ligase family protein [Phycisphaeraceae bacterium]
MGVIPPALQGRGRRAMDREWASVLSACERRDPAGHAVHLASGLLFMAVLPLGTAPGNIMSAVLLGIFLARWRVTLPLLRPLLGWTPTPVVIALVAWLALSITWSHEPDRGVHLLGSLRVFLLPMVLAPLLLRSHWLAGALLGGITLQALVQCGEYALHRGAWNYDGMARFGGFTSDPGKAGLWDAIGVCGGAAMALSMGARPAALGLVLMMVNLLGAVASGTRRQLAALALVLPALLGWALIMLPERRARVVILVVVGAIASLAAWPFMGPSIAVRLRQTTEQLRGPVESAHEGAPPTGQSDARDASDSAFAPGAAERSPDAAPGAIPPPPMGGIVHYDLRSYYWSAVLDGFREHPWRGLGLGSAATAIREARLRPEMEAWLRVVIDREYADRTADENEHDLRSRLNSSHPHSTWLQLLAEGGVIGLLLGVLAWLLAWASVLTRTIVTRGRDPLPLASAAAILLWAIGAIFDASINSTSLGSVVVLAMLGALGSPTGHAQRALRING